MNEERRGHRKGKENGEDPEKKDVNQDEDQLQLFVVTTRRFSDIEISFDAQRGDGVHAHLQTSNRDEGKERGTRNAFD